MNGVTTLALTGGLEERHRSPSVSITDPRPVAALTQPEWVAVVDKTLREVYGMGAGHPLMADVTDAEWARLYADPDRPTTRIAEAASIVAALALCGQRLPLIAGRCDVWVRWIEETHRSRSTFPAWAHVENRRLVAISLFGESAAPTAVEPEKSEALDRALKREHTPMQFGPPPRVVVGARLHTADLPAGIPGEELGGFDQIVLEPAPFVIPPELHGHTTGGNYAAAVTAQQQFTGKAEEPERVGVSIVHIPPNAQKLVEEQRAIGAGFVVGTEAQKAAHLGTLHNDRDIPAALNPTPITTTSPEAPPIKREGERYVVVDDPHKTPQDAAKAEHLERVRKWYAEQRAARKKAGK